MLPRGGLPARARLWQLGDLRQEPPARRSVCLLKGTPRRAGPPYGTTGTSSPAWVSFELQSPGQFSTPIDRTPARVATEATDGRQNRPHTPDGAGIGLGVPDLYVLDVSRRLEGDA